MAQAKQHFVKRVREGFKRWSLKKKAIVSILCGLLILFCFALPAKLFDAPTSFYITDSEGHLLNASIAADGQWRFPFNAQVPEKFAKCIVAFEDKRFWIHPGIDPVAMTRSVKQNLQGGKVVSGGSTLTMQVIGLYKQNSRRSVWNKFIECILAVRMECSYRKKTILALYASNAPFGSNVVGLDAAAWRYFGRAPDQLSWGEMAALAVLPNSPSLVHPGKNRNFLLQKRNGLIDKLAALHEIDATTAALAKLEPLPGEPKALPQLAPHLLGRFKKDHAKMQQEAAGLSTGIQTSIHGALQQQLNRMVAQHHEQLKGNQVNNTAAMVMRVETGEILAYVGNVFEPGNAAMESHVDVLASPRSPGSTLKPLLYASLLTEGTMLPTQLIPDIPTQIGGYAPKNFDLGYDGAVPASKALSRSLNVPAVKMLQQYKYQRFYDVLKQTGFSTLTQPADFYGMSLILGGCEIQPFELAGVYASIARMYLHQGKNKNEWNSNDWFMPSYQKQKTKGGREAKQSSRQPESKLFDYPSIWNMLNAMNEVMRPGEEGLWNQFSSSQKIAWKTGTSFGFRDGWAIGLTAKYCVVVWMGNTNGEGRPGLTGINTAAPLLFDIFRALPTAGWFETPADHFTMMPVCSASGFRAGMDCANTDTILVSESASNASTCPYCRSIHLDRSGVYRVNESCESPAAMQHRSWFVLPPVIEYYYRAQHPDYYLLPSYKAGCSIESGKVLDLIYPEENAKIYVPLEISGEKGRTVFKATHRNNAEKIFWHLDDVFIATTDQFHQLSLDPTPGKHRITIIDKEGNSVSREFEVIGK
jgi:penicillin-binding protein 1C